MLLFQWFGDTEVVLYCLLSLEPNVVEIGHYSPTIPPPPPKKRKKKPTVDELYKLHLRIIYKYLPNNFGTSSILSLFQLKCHDWFYITNWASGKENRLIFYTCSR